MKTTAKHLAVLGIFFSTMAGAEEPVTFSTSMLRTLEANEHIGAVVTGDIAGGWGRSDQGSGIVGDTETGRAGNFTTWGTGTAVSAFAPYGGTALQVEGTVTIERTPGNVLKLYHPDTGELVGIFEFSIE